MSETAYLTAKRTVDDRALNRRVLDQFEGALAESESDPVRILEVGAGTGTMVARLAAWGVLPDRVQYRLVEREVERVDAAREQVPAWLADAGYRVERTDRGCRAYRDGGPDSESASDGESALTVHIEQGDAFGVEGATHGGERAADAVVACAFLDLVALPAGVEELFEVLTPGGVLYAPITFDGLTGFLPAHPLDSTVERLYHRHMAEREGSGPDAGRATLEAVADVGGEVLAAGGSDWVIRPGGGASSGGYPDDEGVVLDHLLSTIVEAVGSLNLVADERVNIDHEDLHRWAARRRTQRKRGDLTVLAHNLDVLARRP